MRAPALVGALLSVSSALQAPVLKTPRAAPLQSTIDRAANREVLGGRARQARLTRNVAKFSVRTALPQRLLQLLKIEAPAQRNQLVLIVHCIGAPLRVIACRLHV